MSLFEYRKKRDFTETKEPKGKKESSSKKLKFVIQKHAARRLHWDLRLEVGGVLISFAVPKEPTLDPSIKRLAIHVEDHPLEYGSFEGEIPKGNYGAGTVEIWDAGTYEPHHDMKEGLKKGHLSFDLHGKKLKGAFTLVRFKKESDKDEWLFYKTKDDKKKVSIPHDIRPMLATLGSEPFNRKEWLFEIKWDGYRAIATIDFPKVTLESRNRLSFENHFPKIVSELKKIKEQMVLDGEVVVLDETGKPNFQMLQNYLNSGHSNGFIQYIVFDILFYEGNDLREMPLKQRKEVLKGAFFKIKSPHIILSEFVEEEGISFFHEAKKLGLEGIMAKDGNSAYLSKRSSSWLKIKTKNTQEAVVVGFTEPKGSRKYFGALLLGMYKEGKLIYIGRSGSGFNQQSLKDIYMQLKPLIQDNCPFEKVPKSEKKSTWVKPKLICDIEFTEWTSDENLRHPIFKGIRLDKDISEAKPEQITNAGKIFWPQKGYTKGDLIKYYEIMASMILPHLKDRPLMLKRYPNGIEGKFFFQKNAPAFKPEWVPTVKRNDINYFVANDIKSLLYIINLGTIELHSFLSRGENISKPDYMVLDLDPEEISYDFVVLAAQAAKELFDELKLPSFCKTSGKRGLHLYIPTGANFPYEIIDQFAKLLAQMIHQRIPEFTSLVRDPKKRQNKVYIDFLQNGEGKTMIAPYSVRALENATVSTPLEWSEIKKGLDPNDYTMESLPKRVKKIGDVFLKTKKSADLERAFKIIEKLK